MLNAQCYPCQYTQVCRVALHHNLHTILPPSDLSDTHFPPFLPPRPHRDRALDKAVPKKSQSRPAAAAATASQPRGPAVGPDRPLEAE